MAAEDLFSVPIFFIVFRETIEAAIIISVLLSFVEQLVQGSDFHTDDQELVSKKSAAMIKRMRVQIWSGALSGLFIAFAIGAAFIAVWYTQVTDLWASSEALWEGIFSIIASLIILMMGVAFLRLDRSRAKWRIKLQAAFNSQAAVDSSTPGAKKGFFSRFKKNQIALVDEKEAHLAAKDKREGRSAKWVLFMLPFITVLREGLEAVVFVAGVSISQPAKATPLPVVCGIIAGLIVGFLIYRGGSAFALHTFLVISTCFLFFVGAGLWSKGLYFCQIYPWMHGVGGDAAESGNGAGSYDVRGMIWHVDYGNPEIQSQGGWMIFNAIFGWNNTGNYGTVIGYIVYWLTIAATLTYLKWQEGRMTFFGLKSKSLKEREARGSLTPQEKPALTSRNTDLTNKSSNEGSDGAAGSSEEGAPHNLVGRLDTPTRA